MCVCHLHSLGAAGTHIMASCHGYVYGYIEIFSGKINVSEVEMMPVYGEKCYIALQ